MSVSTLPTDAASDARVIRQRVHYANISDTYTAARASAAHQAFIQRWGAALLKPWLDATDVESRRSQIVLDPICGNAHVAPFLIAQSDHVWLNDLSPEMLARIPDAIRSRTKQLTPSDATNLPLDDASVDVVAVSGGLHHLHPHLERGIEEMFRVMRPGGCLLFGEPSDDFFLIRWLRGLVYRWSSRFDHESEAALQSRPMRAMLTRAGFERPSFRPFGHIGYMLMAQVELIPLLKRARSRALFRTLSAFDNFVEATPLIKHTCFAMMGAAWKPDR